MNCDFRGLKAAVVLLVLIATTELARADQTIDTKTQQQIASLEHLAFDPVLKPSDVDRLLQKLAKSETRIAARQELARTAQGHQKRIIEFAVQNKDAEVRGACATVVGYLDAGHRHGLHARKLTPLYRAHTAALLPKYWRRFREDSSDARAIAMLLAADPDKAWDWLKQQPGRADRIRYLLLRIRELGADKFTAAHLFDLPAPLVTPLIPEVFPATPRGATKGAYRVIGHVALRWISVVPQSAISRNVTSASIMSVTLIPRLHASFRFRTTRRTGEMRTAVCYRGAIAYGPFHYNSRRPGLTDEQNETWAKYWKKRASRSTTYFQTMRFALAGRTRFTWLPELTLSAGEEREWRSRRGPAAGWIKDYLPSDLQPAFKFADRKAGDASPRVIGREPPIALLAPKIGGPDAPKPKPGAATLLILSPRLPSGSSRNAAIAAELVGDRVSQELASTGRLRIVNRSQIDRVLRERQLNPQAKPPLLSYDAMLRIEADVARPDPVTRLQIVELSTGSVLERGTFHWPVRESDLPGMLHMCRNAMKNVGKSDNGKLKLRWLGFRSVGGFDRLRPLRKRFESHLDDALSRAKGVVRVRHLEAANAKEESLLLLMGLSRLPGGRQFAPQSDATVELRMREFNAVGKTFDETEIEVAYRLRRGAKYTGTWVALKDQVRNFAKLPARLWTKLAVDLKQPASNEAVKYLQELPLRRKQAAAELEAARNVDRTLPAAKQAAARLAHLDAALKLDPTFEAASVERIAARMALLLAARKPLYPVVFEADRHFERFRTTVNSFHAFVPAFRATFNTPVIGLERSLDVELSADDLKLLDALKRLLERSLASRAPAISPETHRMILIVGRGMILADVSPQQVSEWVDKRLKECTAKYRRSLKTSHKEFLRWKTPGFPDWLSREYKATILAGAELAIDCGRFKRAQELIAGLQDRFKTLGRYDRSLIGDMKRVVAAIDDKKLSASFDRWAGLKSAAKTVRPKRRRLPRRKPIPKWPVVKIFGDQKPPSVATQVISSKEFPPGLCPLLVTGKRLYVLKSRGAGTDIDWQSFTGLRPSKAVAVGFIPLDGRGGPRGAAKRINPKSRSRLTYWDTLTWLPAMPVKRGVPVLCARYSRGRMYLGTYGRGFLVFDESAGKWSQIDEQQGLPVGSVYSMFPIDGGRFYCSGRSKAGSAEVTSSHFLFDPATGKSRLLHRTVFSKRVGTVFWWRLLGLWKEGRQLNGWCADGVYENLMSAKPVFHALEPIAQPNAWYTLKPDLTYAVRPARVGSRWFAMSLAGLHEFSGKGKLVRSWWMSVRATGGNFEIVIPADAPLMGRNMVPCGDLLVSLSGRDLTLFDPKADKWYGPVTVGNYWPSYGIGTTGALWLGMADGIRFVRIADLVAAARKSGRVLTTKEYRRRRDAFIKASAPLDQAGFAIALRDFDRARKLLQEVLRKSPTDKDAKRLQRYLPAK